MESTDGSAHVRLSASAGTLAGEEPARERPRPSLTVVWAGTLGGTATLDLAADGVEGALARLAPRLGVQVQGLGVGTAAPRSLADLRARRLLAAIPAARALGVLADREAAGADAPALAASGAPEEWVRKALASREPAPDARSPVERLMQLAGPDSPVSFRDQVEVELARAETVVAQDPEAAALEGAWQRLAWLAKRLDTRAGVRLTAVTAPTLDDLLDGHDLADAMRRASIVVVDVSIGATPRDVERARRLAELGASAGVPVVASAAPMLLGTEGRHDAVPPSRHSSDGTFASWLGLRQRVEARALTLAAPDLRLLPGRDLWGGAALAVAADAVDAWARGDGLAGLGRQPVPQLSADALAITLTPSQVTDLARAGIAALAARQGECVVASAPSVAATDGSPPQEAALSLPAALFTARLGHALSGAASIHDALADELGAWGRIDALDGGMQAVLPASASPLLAADVRVGVQPSWP